MDFWITAVIAFLVLVFFLSICIFVVLSGLLHQVVIEAKQPPVISNDCIIVYKTFTGAYKNVGFLFTEATSINPNLKVFGIYYDDPALTSEDDCCSAIGSILDNADQAPSFEQHGYKIGTLPAAKLAVTTDFPYITFLSIHIAIFRVYPKLSAFIQEFKLRARPMIEIYDGDTIHFIAPLNSQDEFVVPEYRAKFGINLTPPTDVSQSEEDKTTVAPTCVKGAKSPVVEEKPAVLEPETLLAAQEVELPAAADCNDTGSSSDASSFEELPTSGAEIEA